MTKFETAKNEFMFRVKNEIIDYWGSHINKIIYFQGKHWIIKSNCPNPEEKNLSMLAYLLGRGWLNIPEVRFLSEHEFEALHKQTDVIEDGASIENTYLVRLVQDYSCHELAIQRFDDAIASEIAFSCWIHRRDACFGNRAFVCAIPMFFDFNIAFGVDARDFLRSGPDGGYTGNWRFWHIEKEESVGNLVLLRHLEWEKSIAVIPVMNKGRFDQALQKNIKHIKIFNNERIYEHSKKAGFSEERSCQITDFLCRSSEELDTIIGKVLLVLNKDNLDFLYIDNSKYRQVTRSDYREDLHNNPHPPYLSQEIVQEIITLQKRLYQQEKTISILKKQDNYNSEMNSEVQSQTNDVKSMISASSRRMRELWRRCRNR